MNELDLLEQIASGYPNGVITSKLQWLEITEKIGEKITEFDIFPERNTPLIEHKPEYDEPSVPRNSGLVLLREGCEFEIFEDIKLIEIDALYPSITKMLIESGILHFKLGNNSDINDITYSGRFNDVFLTVYNSYKIFKMGSFRNDKVDADVNLDSKLSTFYKTWLNWSYGIYIGPFANIYFSEYVRDIMEKIIYQIPWVYVDTDSIYYVGKTDSEIKDIIDPMCLEYEIQDINFAMFKSKKRFLTIDLFGRIQSKGMVRSKTNDSDYESMAGELMSRNREKLIDTLI